MGSIMPMLGICIWISTVASEIWCVSLLLGLLIVLICSQGTIVRYSPNAVVVASVDGFHGMFASPHADVKFQSENC
jgi:hypothetical protein